MRVISAGRRCAPLTGNGQRRPSIAWAEDRVSAAVLLVPVQPDAEWWALLAGSPRCLLRQPETDQRRLGGRDRTSGAVIGLGVAVADLARAFAGAGWTYQSSA